MIERKEMSLSEWCERLPSIHRVNVELKEIKHQLASRDAEVAELREQVTLLRDAIEWYSEEAKAISRNMKSKNDMAVLASVNVLALDEGKRAALAATDPK